MSDRLTQIVRERYETGACGDAFLMMSKATMQAIPKPPPRPYEPPGLVLMRLWDIPIIFDAALPEGAWRLLERSTGREIEAHRPPTSPNPEGTAP